MTTILTYDVQTYVRELISKEFGSVNNSHNNQTCSAITGKNITT